MLCVVSLNVISQQRNFSITADEYRAVHCTTAEGLESDDNNIMIKDATGFLWIGSFRGGLYRFDGSDFRKYSPGADKGGVLNCDSIFSFREDSLHNIWMGTRKGLSRYDIRADTFTNFITTIDTLNSHRSVYAFWSTSKNVYGLESEHRIVAYNIHTLEKKVFAHAFG
jgi:ligand-binding sensor domain-containing protein